MANSLVEGDLIDEGRFLLLRAASRLLRFEAGAGGGVVGVIIVVILFHEMQWNEQSEEDSNNECAAEKCAFQRVIHETASCHYDTPEYS